MSRPTEPLDPQERALAEALARLPAIDPPPTLDARVLAQARAALAEAAPAAPPRRRLRPWWLSAGLGTAAAATLVAGIAWQAGIFDTPFGSSLPVPRERAPLTEAAPASDAVPVDLSHRARSRPAVSAEAPAEAAREPEAAAPPPPAPPAPPAPAAPATPAAAVAPPVHSAPPPAPAAPAPLRQRREEQAAAAPERAAIATEGSTLDAVQVSGTRLKASAPAGLPHWSQDEQLAPEDWLERVRERVRQGDRPGAIRSLRLFQHRHPSHALPDDLVRLLAG